MKYVDVKLKNGMKISCTALTTKQCKHYCKLYNNCGMYTIDHLYKNPSYKKERIEQDILNAMRIYEGWGYKVLGGNCSHFTCAYLVSGVDSDFIIIETYKNRYYVPVINAI